MRHISTVVRSHRPTERRRINQEITVLLPLHLYLHHLLRDSSAVLKCTCIIPTCFAALLCRQSQEEWTALLKVGGMERVGKWSVDDHKKGEKERTNLKDRWTSSNWTRFKQKQQTTIDLVGRRRRRNYCVIDADDGGRGRVTSLTPAPLHRCVMRHTQSKQ